MTTEILGHRRVRRPLGTQVTYAQRVHKIPRVQRDIVKCGLRMRPHGYSEVGDVAVARTALRIEMCERRVVDEPQNSTAWTYSAGRFLELQAGARVRPESFVGYENMTYSRTEAALRLLGTAMVHLEEEAARG